MGKTLIRRINTKKPFSMVRLNYQLLYINSTPINIKVQYLSHCLVGILVKITGVLQWRFYLNLS